MPVISGAVRFLAIALLAVLRVIAVLFLRILRPVIMWPLMVGTLGCAVATLAFAAGGNWPDAARMAGATLAVTVLLIGYSALVQRIDPEHFAPPVSVRRWT